MMVRALRTNLLRGVSFVCAAVVDFGSTDMGYSGAAIQKRGANFGAQTRVTFCITRVPHTVAHLRLYIYIYIYIHITQAHIFTCAQQHITHI